MVDKYLSVSDIESYINKTFTTETTPTLAQMNEFITRAENDFDKEFGDFSEGTVTDEVVSGYLFGFYTKNFPINSITKLEVNQGTKFDPNWKEITVDTNTWFIDEEAKLIGRVETTLCLSGQKVYRLTYEKGYSLANTPTIIKDIVMHESFKHAFNSSLFKNGQVDNNEQIIDVDVYREITRGGNAFTGYQELDKLIQDKKNLFKGAMKAYLK